MSNSWNVLFLLNSYQSDTLYGCDIHGPCQTVEMYFSHWSPISLILVWLWYTWTMSNSWNVLFSLKSFVWLWYTWTMSNSWNVLFSLKSYQSDTLYDCDIHGPCQTVEMYFSHWSPISLILCMIVIYMDHVKQLKCTFLTEVLSVWYFVWLWCTLTLYALTFFTERLLTLNFS